MYKFDATNNEASLQFCIKVLRLILLTRKVGGLRQVRKIPTSDSSTKDNDSWYTRHHPPTVTLEFTRVGHNHSWL